MKYNKLELIKEVKVINKHSYWLCKCECGNEKIIRLDSVKSGKTQSCGCIRKDRAFKVHGKSRTKLYHIYYGMKQRCYNKNDKAYKHYGLRNIKIDERWLSDFQNFYNWSIENGYKEGLSIDRINVNGNYEPSNCRWIECREQNNNTRRTVSITYDGVTQNINQWAKTLGINKNTFWHYIRVKNYTIDQIIKIKNCRDYSERK